ncbi:MAG: hypothetical protein ACXW3K_05875 [Brevundimonas sp.]
MMKSITLAVCAAGVLAACSPSATDDSDAPVVSEAESPMNAPVDTTPTTGETTQTPGANSFTEGQARGAIESAGYTDVGPLTKNDQGIWQGEGTKAGAKTAVSVDYKGAVTPQ